MASKDFQSWFRDFPERYAPFEPGVRTPDTREKFYRYMELDHTRAQADQRTIEAVLSTETPIIRGGYREILSHEPESVNLERASDGSLPLLWSHDTGKQLGVVENVRVYDQKLRGRLRFSESPLGEEKWRDVQQGILKGISIGYYIETMGEPTTGEHREDLLATKWTPFEVSAVTVPADTNAGIGRALQMGTLTTEVENVELLDRQRTIRNRYLMVENLDGFPDFDKAMKELQKRILAAKTEADFEAANELLVEICNRAYAHEDIERPPGEGAFRVKESEETEMDMFDTLFVNTRAPRRDDPDNFSLCRALAMTFDPSAAREGGMEYEIMQQAASHRGKRLGERYTIPDEVLFRAVTKGGSGGNTIGVDHMGGMYVEALRERMITARMGATVLPGLTADVQIPRRTADASSGWIAGDGSDQVSASDPTFDKISMSPTSVGASTTMSRKMLLQGDPATEMLLRNSLAFSVAKAIDTAAINGDGTSNVPTGILNQTNVASSTYANGGSPGFGDMIDLQSDLAVDDADMGNLGYCTTAAIAGTLKQTDVGTDTGQFVWMQTDEGEGRMGGYRALTSNLIPAGYVVYGNWSDLILGMWSGVDFITDPYTRASYGDIVITVFQDCDVAVRHGESFAEIHEAAP